MAKTRDPEASIAGKGVLGTWPATPIRTTPVPRMRQVRGEE